MILRIIQPDRGEIEVLGAPSSQAANDLPEAFADATVRWTIRVGEQVLLSGQAQTDVPGLNAVQVQTVDLRPVTQEHSVFDLVLTLLDRQGRVVSRYQRQVRCVPKSLLKSRKR